MKIQVEMTTPPVVEEGVTLIAGVATMTFHEPSLEKPFVVVLPAEDRHEAIRLWPAQKALLIQSQDTPPAVVRALRHDNWYIA